MFITPFVPLLLSCFCVKTCSGDIIARLKWLINSIISENLLANYSNSLMIISLAWSCPFLLSEQTTPQTISVAPCKIDNSLMLAHFAPTHYICSREKKKSGLGRICENDIIQALCDHSNLLSIIDNPVNFEPWGILCVAGAHINWLLYMHMFWLCNWEQYLFHNTSLYLYCLLRSWLQYITDESFESSH